MKKRILFLLGALAISSLTSCKKDEEVVEEIPKVPEDVLLYNLPEESSKDYILPTDMKLEKYEDLEDGYQFIELGLETRQLKAVVNSKGYVGIYNVLHNKFVIAPQFELGELQDTFKGNGIRRVKGDNRNDNSEDVVIIRVDYNDKTLVIDNLGNVLYDGKKVDANLMRLEIEEESFYIGTKRVRKNVILFTINQEKEDLKLLTHEDGKLVPVSKYYIYRNNYIYQKISLKELGGEDYTLLYCDYNNNVIVLDKEGKIAGGYNFKMFEEAQKLCVIPINGKLLVQEFFIINSLSETYDFESVFGKHRLQTYSIDLVTGERTYYDLPYLIDGGMPLKDASGSYKFAFISLKEIKNKIVNLATKQAIINDKFEILKDDCNIDFFELHKAGDYYIEDSNFTNLYNDKLEFLGSVHYGFNSDTIYSNGVIEGIYGDEEYRVLFDVKGNALSPVKYSELRYDVDLPYYLGRYNDYQGNEVIDILDSKTHKIIKSIRDIYSDVEFYDVEHDENINYSVFSYVSNNSDLILVNFKTLEEFNLGPSNSFGYGVENIPNDGTFVLCSNGETSEELIINLSPNEVKTYGSEVTTEIKDGRTLFTPLDLTLGDNAIKVSRAHTTLYYKLNISETGGYNFNKDISLYDEKDPTKKISPSHESIYLLAAGKSYIIKLVLDEDTTLSITNSIKMLPLVEKETIEAYDPSLAPIETYRTFNVDTKGFYEVDLASNVGLNILGLVKETNTLEKPDVIQLDGKNIYVLKPGVEYILSYVNDDGSSYEIKPLVKRELTLNDFFEVTNDTLIPFTYDEENLTYTSNNHQDNSESSLEIKMKVNGTLSFDCDLSSEATYDIVTIYKNGHQIDVFEENGLFTCEINVLKDDVIRIEYSKDGSGSKSRDNVIISKLHMVGYEDLNPTISKA